MKEEDLKGPQELKELPNEDEEIEDGTEVKYLIKLIGISTHKNTYIFFFSNRHFP